VGGRHAHPSRGAAGTTPLPVLAAVAGLLSLVAMAMVWLWPDHTDATAGGSATRQVTGVVQTMARQACPEGGGAAGEPTDRQQRTCGSAGVRLRTGAGEGDTITVALPSGTGAPTVSIGDEVALEYSPDNPTGSQYAIVDHVRGTELWVLLTAFILAVVAFGRWRGVSALLGLAFTFAVILGFVIPAILDGKPPLAVAVVGCAAIVLVVLYLTHGIGQTTTVAVAGTVVSLLVTGLLSWTAVEAMKLSGAADDSSFALGQLHGVDLRGLLLAGILIGSLGVLDDVTVTQAATVQELAEANPDYGAGRLYRAALRVGRAHIASVINTIVLAYAGASLPLLVLVVALDDPIGQVLSDQLVATELVRSVAGTIGLISAVPITTAAAAFLAHRRAGKAARVAVPA